MIQLNNRNYCKFCFEPLPAGAYGHGCMTSSNEERFYGALKEGEVLAGKYIVGKVLGKGGFGITYLCYDMIHSCRVAVKEYFPEAFAIRQKGSRNVCVAPKSEAVYQKGAKRFYEEACLLSRFQHPGIVAVKSCFRENNTVYFVMEHLSGQDLKHYMQSRPVSEQQAVEITIHVLQTLRVLHNANVLHRDISPDNIFICDNGMVKLIDFGASRVAIQGESRSLSVILKPGFAPPEQYQSKGQQGPWTDIYALGSTLYYVITKQPMQDAIVRMHKDMVSMQGVSAPVAVVLRKMTAMQAKQRFSNVDEVIFALQKATGTYRKNNVAGAGNFAPQAGKHPGKAMPQTTIFGNKILSPEQQKNRLLLFALLGAGIFIAEIVVILYIALG